MKKIVKLSLLSVECTGSADIIFDLDSSGSITAANYVLMTQFVMSVVQNINIINQTGAVGAQV